VVLAAFKSAACTVTDFRHRATAYGLLNFVGTTAGGVMTYVGGMLKASHVPFAATFQVASAPGLLFAVKPTAPRHDETIDEIRSRRGLQTHLTGIV
jgi:hypothetical protein